MAYTPTINDNNYALTARSEEIRARIDGMAGNRKNSLFTDDELKRMTRGADDTRTDEEIKAEIDAVYNEKTRESKATSPTVQATQEIPNAENADVQTAVQTAENDDVQQGPNMNAVVSNVAEQAMNLFNANPKNAERASAELEEIKKNFEENNMSLEKGYENERAIIKSLESGSDNTMWYGLNKDYNTLNPYDTTPSVEQTDAQKMYSALFYAGQTASIDKLYATQGQALSQFRVNAKTISDMIWDMYGSAGTSESVDKLYGYTIDSVLASLYNTSPTEVAKNREMYKTMAMGKNVDNKTFLGALWDSFNTDAVQTLVAVNSWLYTFTDDEKYMRKIEALEKYEQRNLADYKDRGWLGENLKKTMPILRQGLKGYLLMLTGGAIGSAIGKTIGLKTLVANATANNLFYYLGVAQGAVNDAGIIGSYALAGFDTFVRESGSIIREIDSITDDYGNTVDKDTKILYATLGGLLNAIAEYATPDPIGSQISRFDFAKVMNRGVGSIIANFVANSLAGAVSESTEEFVQSFFSDLAKYAMKEVSNNRGASFDMSEETFSNYLDNAVSSFAEAFFPSLFAGIAGSARGFTATFIDTLINDENARNDIRTTALRTLDAVTAPEASTYTFREEVSKYQEVPRYGKVITENKLDIADNTKLAREEKQNIKEQYMNDDGKLPVIEVTYDYDTDKYIPLAEKDKQIARYLYQVNRTTGYSIKLSGQENLRYSAQTVSVLADNYGGDYNSSTKTLTFNTQEDMDAFISDEFGWNVFSENADGTVTLGIYDMDGNEQKLTVKLGNVQNIKAQKESQLKTKTVVDTEGNEYEVFTDNGIAKTLKSVLPSMSDEEVKTLTSFIRALPANVQNDIIQKLKDSNGDIRDFIISVDTASEEYKNNPEILNALTKGKALSIINDARIVLKDGKTRGKDVVHEVFHVLWNIYPEYRSNLVSALKQTLNSPEQLSQLKEFYEEKKAELDTLGNTASDGTVVGKVDSWESFLDLATKASDISTVEAEQSKNTSFEELFARISTVILQDPSETALETLPSKLKRTFETIISKLKEIYKGLVGESKHAPQALEEAVLSVFNSNLDIDENVNGTRYAEEIAQEEEVRQKYFGTDRWMKAPNGKPTNLTERQWLQVRTPNFIKWFGDWINDPDNASKMLDENDEPMLLYHGTKKDITIFDANKDSSSTRLIYLSKDRTFSEKWAKDKNATEEWQDYVMDNFYDDRRKQINATWKAKETEFGRPLSGEEGQRIIDEYDNEHFGMSFFDYKNQNDKAKVYTLFVNSRNPFDPKTMDYEQFLPVIASHMKTTVEDLKKDNFTMNGIKTGDYFYWEFFDVTQAVLDAGYDALVMSENIGGPSNTVGIRNSNQVKSATDNNGNFSVTNDDIRFSEEFDKYAEQRIEYDGRSGYDTEDDSDRTDDKRGLQADSQSKVWESEQYQLKRDTSLEGIQIKRGRFEGDELRRGSGNYVGDTLANARLISLIQKRFNKKQIDSISFVKLDKNVANLQYFSDKLEKARAGKFGYFVDGKSVSDLLNPDTEVFLSDDGKTGFAIERNYHGHEGVNNISAVFNYSEDGVKPKNGVVSVLINAVQQGGNVLDCFADGLQRMYSQIGFKAFAQNPFAVEYAIGDENWERDYLTQDLALPPVMAMYFDYDNINDYAKNLGRVEELNKEDFSDVPLADDYDEMLEARDRLVQKEKGIRYSEELDEDADKDVIKTQFYKRQKNDNGDIFNPDNPKSILNRKLKNWESLEDGDVEQLIEAKIYIPEKILEAHSNLEVVKEEIADRATIDRIVSIYPEIREIALNAKNEKDFRLKAMQALNSRGLGSIENALSKYYSYSQTLSPTEFSQYFVEMYGSNSTTRADLLALKKLMSTRKVAKVTEDGKKITTVIANDTDLAKLLVKVNSKMTDEQARQVAKQIRRRQGRYVMDLARTLVKMGTETAQMKNADFDTNMTSWLAIALGTEQEDLWQSQLKSGTVNSEMNENTTDKEKIDENNKTLKKAIASNEESFKKLESQLEGKEIKRPAVSSLMRTINRLENQIEAQEMSHNSWKNAYYSAIDQIRLLSNERKAVFKKLSKLVKLNKNISSNYEAKAKRLQTLLMYTEQVGIMSDIVGASLDVQKAFYTEIVQRNKARNELRRNMKYNTATYDSYYIDPTMKYLYRFIHGYDKVAVVDDMSDNEYNVRAIKQGARTDADDVSLVTYDFVAPDVDDMEQVDVEYNPNYPRIDLSNMPKELESALPAELAEGIKNGSIQYRYMTSEDLSALREALALTKHLSQMSKKAKDEVKKSRRRGKVMSIFSSQFKFKASDLTTSEKNVILERMSSDPNFGPSVLSYSDEDIEDYVRRHPEVIFAENADDNKSKFRDTLDIFETQYLKMQRVAETLDGKENGPLYENFFRPLFESYEQKKRWINKRQESFGLDLRTILGEGDPNDKRTVRRNKKLLNETKMFNNNTLFNGNATIKLTGWEQIGAYIYSKNIFGFVKLISSDGNNLSLEEVARINPKDTLKFINIALAQRAQNADVAQKQTNRWWWAKNEKKEGTDYYARDILNHVSETDLKDVQQKIMSGEIDPNGSLSKMMTDIGDTMIKHVSERENEIVRAGYDDYNLLTVLQENYFPLRALDDNLLLQKIKNETGNKNVSKGMLMNRQLTATYALNLNPLVTMYSAIQQQEALINMSQAINDANWLMSSKGGNLKGLLSQKFGSRWGKYFEDYLAVMAGAGDMDLEDMEKLLNKFIGNIAVSKIGANIMVSAKQLVSLIPAMTKGELTPLETLKGFQKLTGNKKEAWKLFIEQQSPSTFYSAYNVEAEKSQRFDETMGGDNFLADMREVTMRLTEKLDGLTKGAIWIAKYEKELKKGVSVQDASFRATQLVQTTQSITDEPSLSKLQRNKNPLVKIAFMFTNDAFQTWNMLTSDVPNAWKQGNRKKAVMEVSGVLLANAVLAFLAGGWLPDDDDEDGGFQWDDFLADFGLEALGNVPIGGSFIQEAFQGFSSPFYQGATQLANLTGMINKQVQYWRTNGKEGKDYEAGDFVDRAFKLVMEGGVSLTGGPVITGERAYKALFPDGANEGLTKDFLGSMWYMLGSKYGKALYNVN